MPATSSPRRPVTLEALAPLRRQYRRQGRVVVWTNGCFDIFHAGHVRSLLAARSLGDVLVVGLNSDASVRALKGEERPFVPEISRAAVLLGLACVDHVVVFDGERCTRELRIIQPDIYAQGADYTIDTIDQDERRAVEEGGGRVEFLPLLPGVSTSEIVQRVRHADRERVISAAFAIIRDSAGRLLLVANRHASGICWGLPGGAQRRGEPLPATVRRECMEETGLAVEPAEHVAVIERIDPKRPFHLVLHLFTAVVVGGVLRPGLDGGEVEDARYLAPAQIAAFPQRILGRKEISRYLQDPPRYPAHVVLGPDDE